MGERGIWARKHNCDRWNLDTPNHYNDGPSDPNCLAPMRFTIGSFIKSGETFTLFDSWQNSQNAHPSLKGKWTGVTLFFDRSCEDIDECIDEVCAMYEAEDVAMPQRKMVNFDESRNDYFEVMPYSECYDLHPHFILSTKNGWKRTPARADPFSGKSAAVMK